MMISAGPSLHRGRLRVLEPDGPWVARRRRGPCATHDLPVGLVHPRRHTQQPRQCVSFPHDIVLNHVRSSRAPAASHTQSRARPSGPTTAHRRATLSSRARSRLSRRTTSGRRGSTLSRASAGSSARERREEGVRQGRGDACETGAHESVPASTRQQLFHRLSSAADAGRSVAQREALSEEREANAKVPGASPLGPLAR